MRGEVPEGGPELYPTLAGKPPRPCHGTKKTATNEIWGNQPPRGHRAPVPSQKDQEPLLRGRPTALRAQRAPVRNRQKRMASVGDLAVTACGLAAAGNSRRKTGAGEEIRTLHPHVGNPVTVSAPNSRGDEAAHEVQALFAEIFPQAVRAEDGAPLAVAEM